MRFLVRLKATNLPRDRLLDATRTIARSLGADPRNPKWTSYGALELDIFCPSRNDFELFVSAIKPVAEPEFTKDLNVTPPYMDESELFAEARALFNAERYWECHEVLEGLWRQKHREEKSLLQGIILVCAAFVHHQKGEDDVGIGVLQRAAKQLEFQFHVAEYGGFDLASLRVNAQRILKEKRFTNFRV